VRAQVSLASGVAPEVGLAFAPCSGGSGLASAPGSRGPGLAAPDRAGPTLAACLGSPLPSGACSRPGARRSPGASGEHTPCTMERGRPCASGRRLNSACNFSSPHLVQRFKSSEAGVGRTICLRGQMGHRASCAGRAARAFRPSGSNGQVRLARATSLMRRRGRLML
jgi:hypothetical protein